MVKGFMFIHELNNWTQFSWDHDKVDARLAEVSQALGYLHGRLSMIGFDEQLKATAESVTQDIVSSSEIEGVSLNTRSVRSSVARRLGVPYEETNDALSHYVEGMVSVSLDATRNYMHPLTAERLFAWHGELFPPERTRLYRIDVGQYRKVGMQVVSGNMGRERVCYEAPAPERVPAEMEQFIGNGVKVTSFDRQADRPCLRPLLSRSPGPGNFPPALESHMEASLSNRRMVLHCLQYLSVQLSRCLRSCLLRRWCNHSRYRFILPGKKAANSHFIAEICNYLLYYLCRTLQTTARYTRRIR